MIDTERISSFQLSEIEFLRMLIDRMNEGVVVSDTSGRVLLFNSAAEEMLGPVDLETPQSEWSRRYGLFMVDQQTLYPSERFPLWRALRGETVRDVHMYARNCRRQQGCWLDISSKPFFDRMGNLAGGLLVSRELNALDVQRRSLESKPINQKSLRLTPREKQILKLIAAGKTPRQIAEILGVRYKTAVAHRTRLMAKLDIHETATLTRYAIRKGIIEA